MVIHVYILFINVNIQVLFGTELFKISDIVYALE